MLNGSGKQAIAWRKANKSYKLVRSSRLLGREKWSREKSTGAVASADLPRVWIERSRLVFLSW
jgi:hypothetical protein